MNEFVGKCPVCQKQLSEAGGIVACPDSDDHFRIRLGVWNAAWGKWDSGTIKDGTVLLGLLLRANIAPNKPERNRVRA